MHADYTVIPLPHEEHDPPELRMKINTTIAEIREYLAALEGEVKRGSPDFDRLRSGCFELLCRLPLPILQFTHGFVLRSRRNFNGEVFRRTADIS
jgi:hypothetical protein